MNEHARQHGYTLVEVVVGALLATMIVLLTYSAYVVASKLHARWTDQATREQIVHVNRRQMLVEFRRSAVIVQGADCQRLLIVTAYHDSTTYARSQKKRDGYVIVDSPPHGSEVVAHDTFAATARCVMPLLP